MQDKKKNARSTVGAAERARMGADFAGHVPNFDFNMPLSEMRVLFAEVAS